MTPQNSVQAIHDETVTIENDSISLEGTLTTPANEPAKQVVLLVAGSGPLDRNQNAAKIQLNLFNSVAEHLAEHAIASLRYDKRGCGNSTGDYNSAGHSDLVQDAAACLEFLTDHPTFAQLPTYVLGHSEGAIIAPQLIAKNTNIAGQILLCPFTENYQSVIHRQAEKSLSEFKDIPGFKGKVIRLGLRLSGDQMAKQRKLIERIKKSTADTLKVRKQMINAKWIREMIDIDAASIHAKVTAPTLMISGEKDLQSLPEDLESLRDIITAPLESYIIDDLTHILRRDSQTPSIQHYGQLLTNPVDEELLQKVSQWLIARQ